MIGGGICANPWSDLREPLQLARATTELARGQWFRNLQSGAGGHLALKDRGASSGVPPLPLLRLPPNLGSNACQRHSIRFATGISIGHRLPLPLRIAEG